MVRIATCNSTRARLTCLLGLLVLILLQACSASKTSEKTMTEPAGSDAGVRVPGDLDALRRQARALESKVHKLGANMSRLYPSGPAILVDTSQSRLALMSGSRLIAEGTCSTGNGMELTDGAGKRSWTFDTPRGHFRVLSKVANPVWYRPDWSYIEEGEPIPKDRSKRAEANVLGDYALAFGNGFFIHGTLYTRLLGTNVTHGCIRVDDDLLKKLFAVAQPGTPIWIY
jgi:L,D-transpeptidase ErfK/SrfK